MNICSNCSKQIPEQPKGSCTTGYGKDQYDNVYCYECCLEHELKEMRETGKTMLYLNHKKLVENPEFPRSFYYTVTNWTGLFERRIYKIRESKTNWGLTRKDFWFDFEGFEWWGKQIGEMSEIAYCKRTKKKA